MRQTIKVISLGLISMMMAHSAFANEAHHDMQGMQMENMDNMDNMKGMDNGMKKQVNTGAGEIKSIDMQQHKITIAHGPIASINWPAMNMTFVFTPVADSVKTLKAGEKVDFSFVQQGNDYVLQSISAK